METTRKIAAISKSRPTMEGAGVRLKRAFGQAHEKLDPFLLLDDFHSDNPDDYIAGFPWHPHRGIETITYMLKGRVLHGDSLGNEGEIGAGDVQWMTAGSGIIHEEMPKNDSGLLWGFQLWANLPTASKMMAPRYQEIKSNDIPTVAFGSSSKIKIICGQVGDVKGSVRDIITNPTYLDVTVEPALAFSHRVPAGQNVFAYVIEGEGFFGGEGNRIIQNETLVIFDDGDQVNVVTKEKGVRFLLISGQPIREPVAWQGPIVMNTEQELRIAFEEYANGTFIKNN